MPKHFQNSFDTARKTKAEIPKNILLFFVRRIWQFCRHLKPRDVIHKIWAYGLRNCQCFLHTKCVHVLKRSCNEPQEVSRIRIQHTFSKRFCVQDSQADSHSIFVSSTVIICMCEAHYQHLLSELLKPGFLLSEGLIYIEYPAYTGFMSPFNTFQTGSPDFFPNLTKRFKSFFFLSRCVLL